jgi:hypothetical protein
VSKSLKGSELAAKIASSPRWFAGRIFGTRTWPKQEEIIGSVFKHKRVAVRGCVASTKTFAAALTTLAWLMAHPKTGRVFHLAPSFRQVDKNLWGYIKQLDVAATKNGTPIGARVFQEPRLVFGPGWEYVGFNTDTPHNLHGIHGPNDLIVLDDAHGIGQDIFDELENMFAGGDTRLLILFNPVVVFGETYDCAHGQKALWHNIKVSFDDLKAAYAAGHEIPGALQQETVDMWAKKFGVTSNFYRSKVDAEYPKEEADSVVPLSWVEAATMRDVPPAGEGQLWHGQDVARFGDDESVLCTLEGRRQLPLEAVHGARTTETAGKLVSLIRQKGGSAAVDVIGVGSGVVDSCHEADVEVIAINVAEASEILDEAGRPKFANLRSEMYWAIREALDPQNPDALALDPEDKQLHGELCAMKWKLDSQGRIVVEAKADMKKRIGHSPDRADALGLAILARRRGTAEISIPSSLADRLGNDLGEREIHQMGALEGLELGV